MYDQLYKAGEAAENYMEQAESQPGYDPATDYLSAEEVALRTWIYLPDLDYEEDGYWGDM